MAIDFPISPDVPCKSRSAFTILELLVAMAVMALIMVVIGGMFSAVSKSWKSSSGRAASFAAARAAFEAMSRNLSQATLATYLSYADSSGNPVPLINPSFKPASGSVTRSSVPTQYLRMSELHFITDRAAKLFAAAGISGLVPAGQAIFFQAPTSFVQAQDNRPKASLLNVMGYYIEFGADDAFKPGAVNSLVASRQRYRLMEVAQPAERNGIYESTCELDAQGLAKYTYDLRWLARLILVTPTDSTPLEKQPLAENVITMALLPRLSPFQSANLAELTKDFSYDSRAWEVTGSGGDPRLRNQLPPLIELVIVAIDEPSAQKLAGLYGGADGSAPPFADAAVRAKVDLDALFKDPTKLETDIKSLEDGLNNLQVNYRVFRTTVAMHGAKWTER
ncbi:MAG: Verru_Chthon cassette protein C [Verrucomicrobiota bacterium]